MDECKYVFDFIETNDLDNITKINNCNCKYCKNNYDYDNYINKINNIKINNKIEFNSNINLIWTKSMIYIKKYLLIFENYNFI